MVVTGGYSSVKKSQTAHGCPGGSYHTMLDAVFQNCLSIFYFMTMVFSYQCAAATAAKSLQSCPTLCNPIDCSPPGSAVPGILQARTLEWVAISFSIMLFIMCVVNKIYERFGNFSPYLPMSLVREF